jgi:hypothetical protein
MRATEHNVFTDAALAANERLAKAHPAEYARLLKDEFTTRNLDFNTYLEANNIAAGSI